ncbi:MAG: outer membrane beta-barrel protein [Candidatus Saccharicenans sp.]|uniref:outer membrane beta-barrel protein n=1 Tax=Candidatus Saccharicenans sp. TaxID=2819258 RepID=UPI00404B27BB
MKRVGLVLLVILILAWPLQAMEFKRIIGPAFSSFSRPWPGPYPEVYPVIYGSGSTLSPFRHNRFSFLGGLGLEFSLSRMLELELEVLYKETGGQYPVDTGFFDSYFYEFQLKEISAPLLLQIHFWKKSRPYVLAGMDFSFILSNRCQIFYRPEAGQILEKVLEADLRNWTRKTDMALVLGLGFEAAVYKRRVFVEGRYELGLPDLYQGPALDYEGRPVKVRSRQFLLIVGYAIR